MRPIKFRAWDGRRLFYPSSISWKDGAVWCCDVLGNNKYESMIEDAIVEQFTGLLDKNGKEIYEGDILRHSIWGNSVIVWEHGMFRGIGNEHDVTLADHQLARSRVVGNIHEHPERLPELLKGYGGKGK